MPATEKKITRTARKTAGRKQTRPRSARKTPGVRRLAKPKSRTKSLRHKAEETTFVYECTEPGCGYRIWRGEKDETGHLRFDLKCPKCHRKVFRCLGQGDVPESFQAPPPPVQLDFDAMKTAELGSN